MRALVSVELESSSPAGLARTLPECVTRDLKAFVVEEEKKKGAQKNTPAAAKGGEGSELSLQLVEAKLAAAQHAFERDEARQCCSRCARLPLLPPASATQLLVASAACVRSCSA